MLRLSGGDHKGRALKWLDTPTIRPTPARVREAIFNIFATETEGSTWWDLCCGSGVVGLEALSHGAGKVMFVDQNRRTLHLLRENLATFGFSKQAQAHCQDVLRWIKNQKSIDTDFIFCDPPYSSPIYQPVLDALGELPLAPGREQVRMVVEYRKRDKSWQLNEPWVLYDERAYGDTCLAILVRETK